MSEEKSSITPDERRIEEAKAKLEEQRIQFEEVEKQYNKLKKDDPRFIGIDLPTKQYWIAGHGWQIKKLGITNRKAIMEYFTRHDSIVAELSDIDTVKDSATRVKLTNEMLQLRDEICIVCIPLVLMEIDGKPFDTKKWFDGDDIPSAAWWNCIMDCFLFLRESGSRDDMLLSMMPRNSE